MKSIEAWQGDTIRLTTTAPDDTAVTATLLVGLAGATAIFSKEATYNDAGVADLTITDEENVQSTIPFGEYTYMIRVSYSDGAELSFPKPGSCGGGLPKFIIKERIEDA